MQLEGGAFQSLFDEYLYKKYKLTNLQALGVQTGTNKPTKGVPDAYVLTEDEKYILINYGSVSSQPADKIAADILDCLNSAKVPLEKDKIKKIICGHCSTNIHIEQFESIRRMLDGIEIELIGIDTISHDLALKYPNIAKNQLGISIDTNQFFDIEDFVKNYDANGINAPIDCTCLYRKDEINDTCMSIHANAVTVLTGPSGIGKTRLAIEVCREQCEEYKVYCIRSNGNLLYDDIKYYIDEPGKYMLFLDDANMIVGLDNVLQNLLTLPREYEIRILITVRDYAKERVITTVSQFTLPKVIKVGRFTDEEICNILKTNLEILNPDYLKRISEIANGNSRLAYLAGIRSVDKGYCSIRSAEDIFKNYYGYIISTAKLTKDDAVMLFIIAFAGPVREGQNKLYDDLMEHYGESVRPDETVEKLYALELIDWFKDEVTKISDQSLGNYIIYYVLVEKKWISIEDIIKIAFPAYRNKVTYALNTIVNIFASDEATKYIENSIISAWNNAPIGQNIEYLETFYQVNPIKALSVIKRKIDQERYADFDMQSFDVEKRKSYHTISTKEIEILGGFKYTTFFKDSIDLLVLYFKKRPDLIMDFYFVICEYFLFDKDSWKYKYNNENILIDRLWKETCNGEKYNFSILYIHVLQYALKTEFNYAEEVRNRRTVSFVRMTIGFSEEIALLRNKLWKTLGILRTKKEYQKMANDILAKVYLDGLEEKDAILYLQSDFNAIFEYVIKKDDIDFHDARIINSYREASCQMNGTVDERYSVCENNPEFRIYKILSREHLVGRTFEEDETVQKRNIAALVDSYGLEEYRNLFDACNYFQEAVGETNIWSLCRGLDLVFEILEADPGLYVNVIEEYFNKNAPFRLNGYRQVCFLLSTIGYEKTYILMSKAEYRGKDTWLSLIWSCIRENEITDRVVHDYSSFLEKNLGGDNLIVPSPMVLVRYGDRDNRLKSRIIMSIAEQPRLSVKFLEYVYDNDDIKAVIHIFEDKMDVLSRIYINALEANDHVDYGGKLFAKIFDRRPSIWKEYVDWVKEHMRYDGYGQMMFEFAWSTEKWRECINYAFSVLLDDNIPFFIEDSAQLIFGRVQQESNTVQNRKKQWLLECLHENYMDISICIKLIDVVVNVMPEWKLDFILEFLKENKNIEDFKSINLFPLSGSWSGSEVPLIMDKIEFLRVLGGKLEGIFYIEHREYIDEYRRTLEKYKKEVELREYIMDADYA